MNNIAFGKELIFISAINRDGLGITMVDKDNFK